MAHIFVIVNFLQLMAEAAVFINVDCCIFQEI